MGSISFQHVNRLLAQPEIAIRVFGEVRFRPPRVTAMRVARDLSTSEWVFVTEIPVSFSVALREQAFCDASGRLHVGRWARLEVQVDAKSSTIRPGWFLTATAHPTSLDTTLYGTFKRSSRKKRKPSMQPFPGIFDSAEALAQAIESMGHDFWEKGAYLTAGFPLPLLGKNQSNRERSRLPLKGAWVLGCCETDPEEVIRDLREHPLSTDLLEWARSGRIRFQPMQSRRKRKQGEEPDEAFLASAIKGPKGAASEYLARAIQQALGGPALKYSKRWRGRRVIELVDALFRDHLNDENRLEVRRIRGISSTEREPELADQKRGESDEEGHGEWDEKEDPDTDNQGSQDGADDEKED